MWNCHTLFGLVWIVREVTKIRELLQWQLDLLSYSNLLMVIITDLQKLQLSALNAEATTDLPKLSRYHFCCFHYFKFRTTGLVEVKMVYTCIRKNQRVTPAQKSETNNHRYLKSFMSESNLMNLNTFFFTQCQAEQIKTRSSLFLKFWQETGFSLHFQGRKLSLIHLSWVW